MTALSIASALLFLVFALQRILGRRNSGGNASTTDRRYAVLSRNGRQTTLRIDGPGGTGYLWGFVTAAAFFWAFPLLAWRYGAWRALLIIAVPMAIASGAAALWTTDKAESNTSDRITIAIVLMVPLRSLVGLWVVPRDARMRMAALKARGWVTKLEVDARSARMATRLGRSAP